MEISDVAEANCKYQAQFQEQICAFPEKKTCILPNMLLCITSFTITQREREGGVPGTATAGCWLHLLQCLHHDGPLQQLLFIKRPEDLILRIVVFLQLLVLGCMYNLTSCI